jgi:hypothetical protein
MSKYAWTVTDSRTNRSSSNTGLRGLRLFVGGAMAFACAAGAVGTAIAGHFILAALLTGATVFWLIPFSQLLLVGQFVPRAAVDDTGTVLEHSRGHDVLGLATSIGAIAVLVPWAVLGTLGQVSFPFPDMFRHAYVMVFGGTAAMFALALVKYVQHGGTGFIRLTPNDFVFAEAYWTTKGSWSQVVAVTDDPPVRGHGIGGFKIQQKEPYAVCPITVVMANGTRAAVGNATSYAADGDALREWIRFYWANPEHRAELNDERALTRLHTWTTSEG